MNIIAIDGPAGSGKSTVAKSVAAKLGYLYIDTGAMYRTVTLKALEDKVALDDKQALIAVSDSLDFDMKYHNNKLQVSLEGKDVSDQIRELNVSSKVKYLAGIKEIRNNMVRLQRGIAKKAKNAVLEGRDIGTVVFPDAKYKFYIDASFKERVRRRFDELKQKKSDVAENEVMQDLVERDKSDMTRSVGPLKKADDSIVIDTTDLSIKEVTEKILSYMQ